MRIKEQRWTNSQNTNKKQSSCKKEQKNSGSGKVSDTWQQKKESWNLSAYTEEITIKQADPSGSGMRVFRMGLK